MTETLQVTRAGPVLPGGRTIQSTGRKDLQTSSSFLEIFLKTSGTKNENGLKNLAPLLWTRRMKSGCKNQQIADHTT